MTKEEYDLQIKRTKEFAKVHELLTRITNLDVQLNVPCEIRIYCMPDGRLQISTLIGSKTATSTLEAPQDEPVRALINKIVDEKVIALSEQIKAI